MKKSEKTGPNRPTAPSAVNRSNCGLRRTALATIAIATCLGIGTHSNAFAGTWRCGNSYTDRPCGDGKQVDAGDERSALQRRDADNTSRDARTAANRLERERLRDEAAGARRGATILSDVRPAAVRPFAERPEKKNKRSAPRGGTDFIAHDPVATERNKAARKAAKPASQRTSRT